MTTIKKKIVAKVKKEKDEKIKGFVPAVFYGPKKENISLLIDQKEASKIYKEAGESTLISLEIEGKEKMVSVLIYDVQKNPLTGAITHIDFFAPNLKEEVEAEVNLIFVGVAPAVKDLNGTFVKNTTFINVKALPQNLPHEIEVNIEKLATFEDAIHIKDLVVSDGVKIVQDPEMVVAMVSRPADVEAELEKPIKEEEVKVEGEKEDKAEKEDKEDKK